MIQNVIQVFVGFLVGVIAMGLFYKFYAYYIKLKFKQSQNLIFDGLLKRFEEKKVKFLSRINNYVTFTTKLNDMGKVEVVYFLDTKTINIFKNKICVHTSMYCDIEIVKSIQISIMDNFNTEINDTIQIMNNKLDKSTYFKMLKEKGVSDGDVYFENEENIERNIFTIDDILDKINEVGIDKLTNEEKDFLKKNSHPDDK